MIVGGVAKVVEFNCRFGDPETQVVLPLLESDLLDFMQACAAGDLGGRKLSWREGSAVCVIMASGGYPKAYKKNLPIDGVTKAKSLGAMIFHAGTKLEGNELVTNGGRVLGVTATAPTLREAVDKAYRCVDVIHFDDVHFRRDIAFKGTRN